jgi:hypothetical protein
MTGALPSVDMTDFDDADARMAALEARLDALERRAGARQLARGAREKTSAFDPQAWQKTLSTPGGVAAVASALATHIRQILTPLGLRALPSDDLAVGKLEYHASVAKVVEVLEAATARLREFEPSGAGTVDLSPLGARPFQMDEAKLSHLACSFCGKAQKEVTKLIAGPCVYICNECVDLSVSIINEG